MRKIKKEEDPLAQFLMVDDDPLAQFMDAAKEELKAATSIAAPVESVYRIDWKARMKRGPIWPV